MEAMVSSAQWHLARLPHRLFAHVAVTLAALALAVSAQNASATTIVLSPVVDQSAEDANPRDGVFERLFPEGEDDLEIFNGSSEFRGVMEFELPQMEFSYLSSAILHLEATGIGHGDVPDLFLRLDGYAANGTVELADFSVDNLIADLHFDRNSYGVPPLAVDITAFVRSAISVGDQYIGCVLRTAPGVTFYLASDEHAVPWIRPQLELRVMTVAEPSMTALSGSVLAAGLLPLLLIGRWRGRREPLEHCIDCGKITASCIIPPHKAAPDIPDVSSSLCTRFKSTWRHCSPSASVATD